MSDGLPGILRRCAPASAACLIIVAAALAATTGAAVAQTVQGSLRGAASGEPVEGAFVLLHDSAGGRVAAALSDSAGRYLLRAKRAGMYLLRVERLGVATYETPHFRLSAGETLTRHLTLPEQALLLGAIDVKAERRGCHAAGDLSAQAAGLWEEARKALSVAAWSSESDLSFRIARSLREYEAASGRMLIDESDLGQTESHGSPWQSAPAGILVREGFLRPHPSGGYLYYGPDAAVLLSDVFLDTHCFVMADNPEDSGLVGLRFRPMQTRDVTDIVGTLWMRSGALHSIDFEYVRLPFPVDMTPGGRIGFRRLRNGVWILSAWELRLPRMSERYTTADGRPRLLVTEHHATVLEARDSRGGVLYRDSSRLARELPDSMRVADLPIAGGAIPARLFAAQRCGHSPGSHRAHVAGLVATAGTIPLSGATVEARVGASDRVQEVFTATTDGDGLYVICDLRADAPIHLLASYPGFETGEWRTRADSKGVVGAHFQLRVPMAGDRHE